MTPHIGQTPLQRAHRAMYAAFDVYPSAKGAATHIHHMTQSMFDAMEGGLLCSLGNPILPVYQKEGNCELLKFSEPIPHFLERTLAYGRWLKRHVKAIKESLVIAHFRDPWSGVPLLTSLAPHTKTIYEVNGLPSIELPYAFPQISPRTLDKIQLAERFCLESADHILTPSSVLKENLVLQGVPATKIEVLTNGADLYAPCERPQEAPEAYILYFGALQHWQGVDTLLRAFARLLDVPNLRLVVISSVKPKRAKELRRLSRRLEIAERVDWLFQLSKEELRPWLVHALLTVAPLTECSRNLEQGCCPLKILESMAAGVPVVASRLPVVEELMEDRTHGLLVRAQRPDAFARAIRVMLECPEKREEMGKNARAHIEAHYTWEMISARYQTRLRALVGEDEGG